MKILVLEFYKIQYYMCKIVNYKTFKHWYNFKFTVVEYVVLSLLIYNWG